MKIPFLDLKYQHEQIKNNLNNRFNSIFDDTSFVLGEDVKLFEKKFADYINVKFSTGVASGTDALILALRSLDVGMKDEVITIPTTFIATASAIVHVGAKPVFVDIDIETRNFDFDLLEKAVTKKTKAIIPVHLYGQPVDMDRVMELAKKHNLRIIEDTCQAQGALYDDKQAGTFGDLSCFSFYPGKNLGAYGEGGAIATNNENLNNKIQKLRNHGGIKKYEHELVGYNSRLDSLQAAVLDEKLKFLNEWNGMRIEIADKYNKALKEVDAIKIYPTLPRTKSVFHLYVIKLLKGNRAKFMDYLTKNGIGSAIHYPTPLHLTHAFEFLEYKKGDFPISENYCDNIVSLPIFPGMTGKQVDHVIKIVKDFFNKNGNK